SDVHPGQAPSPGEGHSGDERQHRRDHADVDGHLHLDRTPTRDDRLRTLLELVGRRRLGAGLAGSYHHEPAPDYCNLRFRRLRNPTATAGKPDRRDKPLNRRTRGCAGPRPTGLERPCTMSPGGVDGKPLPIRRGVMGSTSDFGSDGSGSSPGGGASLRVSAPEAARPRPRPSVSTMSNAWLVGRARELRASVQTSERAEQLRIIDELDVLLQEAKRRGDPLMIADLLR